MWVLLNVIYGAVLVNLPNLTYSAPKPGEFDYQTSSTKFLNAFALFVASLVIFKTFFAAIYQIKWYIRICCIKEYKKNAVDNRVKFKQMWKDRNAQVSSDEEDDINDMEATQNNPQQQILKMNIIEDDMEFDDDDGRDDQDDDFAGAEEEEEEDRLRETMRKSQNYMKMSHDGMGFSQHILQGSIRPSLPVQNPYKNFL